MVFINIKPYNYYLDQNLFKKCYFKCETCSEKGTEEKMNCASCDNIKYKLDQISKNCIIHIQKCDYNFYYENENLICLEKNELCPIYIPYELIESKECIELCSGKDFINSICKTNNQNLRNINITINNIKYAIENKLLDSIIENITKIENNDIIKQENYIIYQITTSKNQNNKLYENISTINITECEEELKDKNIISKDSTLLIFKIDLYSDYSLTPIVLYAIYNYETKERLNLKYCENKKVIINVPTTKKVNEKEKFLYDPHSDFYHDICFKYTTEYKTDITLNDRKREFFDKNRILCDIDCKFINYDNITKKVSCECDIIDKLSIFNINITKEGLLNSFLIIKI